MSARVEARSDSTARVSASSTTTNGVSPSENPRRASLSASRSVFYSGLVLLGLAWIGLVGASERLRGSTRRRIAVVAVIAGAWTLPILLGPPLLGYLAEHFGMTEQQLHYV